MCFSSLPLLPSPSSTLFSLSTKFCVYSFFKSIKFHLCHPYSLGFVAFYWGMVSLEGAYTQVESPSFSSCVANSSSVRGEALCSPLHSMPVWLELVWILYMLCGSCTCCHNTRSSLVQPPCVWNTLFSCRHPLLLHLTVVYPSCCSDL